MSSGYGVWGGPGRCHSFWVDFVQCMEEANAPKDCTDLKGDYFECLHHKKQIARQNAIAEQYRKVGPKPAAETNEGG